MRFIAALVVNA